SRPETRSRVGLLGRLGRPAATALRLRAGRAARTPSPAPAPAALHGAGPADAAQEIRDLLAAFLAHALSDRGNVAFLSWRSVLHRHPQRSPAGSAVTTAPRICAAASR